MSDVLVQTDSFGTIRHAQWVLYKKRNVTPAEHTALCEKFGHDAYASHMAFVEEHTVDGSYREPWPFPY